MRARGDVPKSADSTDEGMPKLRGMNKEKIIYDTLRFHRRETSYFFSNMVPNRIFFTKGVGRNKERLAAFELALEDAGIAKCNLVYVSSIFPPACKRISKEEGLKVLQPGEITYCVLARSETNEPNRLISAAIGLALPADPGVFGYLSEHHTFGATEEKTGEYAEDLAASMLATTLGIEFDANTAWDEREQLYKASGKIIRTSNICQSAIGDKNGNWTVTIAAAVFLDSSNVQANNSQTAISQPNNSAIVPNNQ